MAQPDPAGNVPETATRTVSVTDTKIPYLEMLNITSDNANNTRATINDILTITLETNETLAGANITALNGTFQMITENDTVTINLPVPANHPTGNATFNITARVLFALSLVMFNISRYGIFVSVTDTVLVAVSGTFPAGSGCAMYSIRYVPGIRELTALVLDVIVLLYAGSSSVTLAPFSTYSLYSSTDYSLPLMVRFGFIVSTKTYPDVRFASVTYKVLFCASRAVMLNVALPVG